ncbi:NACHT, LRR and PYD domains-containing protein 14 [Holothuria leucospilota]|uniref:NACHT, LRR and PYD domains-containing protein 14 n=1 Tax=Holothuria leucospilota TaxID=206669 RepID=A0A9Q1CPS7_HOLLE|nr:NACHT, LRR and PYD domains-containing protein 14 [Holothuria leucospilota]
MVFVEGGMEYYSGSTWMKMGSYDDCVIAPPKSATRSFIVGGAGYGKSTLALQYAYDWCNNVKHSFMRNYEIMILLRLRQLAGVPSIFTAIRRFILPKHSTIKESDIKQILGASTSVAFILDGLDEYPEDDFTKDFDVMKIILNKMFQNFEIIITSRYLPKYRSDMGAKRIRLTGFTCDAQKRYIQKAVVNDKMKTQKIMHDIHDNPVVEDFCQIPLFFVMFAHMSQEEKKEDFASCKTVTGFFRNMIKCFHTHMRNKLKDANVQQYFLYERDHRELDLIAFRGLSADRQQIVWPKDYLRERLGGEFYDQYVRIGILVEEEVLKDDPNSLGITQTVRFYHKLFCEWYAAHYVAYVTRSEISLQDFLKRTDPAGNQYMYRFACGLSREASDKIIKYVKGKPDGSKFAILCIMEQNGNTDIVLDNVKDLCSRKVILARDQSKLLQRSTIQLLEIASTEGVSL